MFNPNIFVFSFILVVKGGIFKTKSLFLYYCCFENTNVTHIQIIIYNR